MLFMEHLVHERCQEGGLPNQQEIIAVFLKERRGKQILKISVVSLISFIFHLAASSQDWIVLLSIPL